MTEILFVLATTMSVFALFLLVLFIRGRSDGDEPARPTCAQCDCHRSEEEHEGCLEQLGRTEKDFQL